MLGGLAFWYDAEESPVVEDGGALSQWNDLSGNANHASQAASAQRPVKITDADGRDVVRFDGVDDVLDVATPPDLSSGLTLFVVFRLRASVDFGGIAAASAATGVDHEQYFAFQNALTADKEVQLLGKSLQSDPVDIKRPNSTEIQYALFTVGSASGLLRDLNGESTDASTDIAFGTPAAFVLGARLENGAPFNWGAVDIYEIGVYSRVLTNLELDQIDTYCRARRGLVWNPMHIGGDLQWFHDVVESGFTLGDGLVSQWNDMTDANRHWEQSGSARPLKTKDGQDRDVVRFDGIDDIMLMAGSLPALEPFSVAIVYTIRVRDDLTGILTAAPGSGADHSDFWTFRVAATPSDVELFGRSLESDQLSLTRPDNGDVQVAIWTTGGSSAELLDASGGITDTYGGNFGTPAEIVLGGRYDGAPFGLAKIDVMATVGVARALSADEQQKLLDWTTSRWGI